MIKNELYRNLGLAAACVFVVTLVLIANLWTSLLVFSCVIMTLVTDVFFVTDYPPPPNLSLWVYYTPCNKLQGYNIFTHPSFSQSVRQSCLVFLSAQLLFKCCTKFHTLIIMIKDMMCRCRYYQEIQIPLIFLEINFLPFWIHTFGHIHVHILNVEMSSLSADLLLNCCIKFIEIF